MRQHDAAGADANRAGGGAYRGQQHFWRAAGNGREGVVLRNPEALVSQLFAPLGHGNGLAQGLGGLVGGACQ